MDTSAPALQAPLLQQDFLDRKDALSLANHMAQGLIPDSLTAKL